MHTSSRNIDAKSKVVKNNLQHTRKHARSFYIAFANLLENIDAQSIVFHVL